MAAYVACSLVLALHSAKGTSYFKKNLSLCCPNPVCFLCAPKGQKAKQLVPFWHAGGKALAMKSESLMQQVEMKSSTHGIRKDNVSKKNPQTQHLYILRSFACFQDFPGIQQANL